MKNLDLCHLHESLYAVFVFFAFLPHVVTALITPRMLLDIRNLSPYRTHQLHHMFANPNVSGVYDDRPVSVIVINWSSLKFALYTSDYGF